MHKDDKNKKTNTRKNTDNPKSTEDKQTRYLSQAIQLEEVINPNIIRSTMIIISAAIIAFVVWSGLTNINEVARTAGEVVPYGHQQIVQHLEGGIVEKIMVREGDIVDEGQTLIVLSDASLRKDLQHAQIQQRMLEMQAVRLRSFIEGEKPDLTSFKHVDPQLIQDQISLYQGMKTAREKEVEIIYTQLKDKEQSLESAKMDIDVAQKNLTIAKDVFDRRKKLHAKGYSSEMQLLEDEQRLVNLQGEYNRLKGLQKKAQNEINEYKERLASTVARHNEEAYQTLVNVEEQKSQNLELIHKLDERLARLDIKAPTSGLIKGLAVNTINAVIQPAQKITEIVPLDKELEVQVKIAPKDIGHLAIGQDVNVKFSSYDFSRYGYIKGELAQISATTFKAENGDRSYHGRITLDRNYVGQNPDNTIVPGMTVMADVITGRKTILQYLLKPIHLSLQTAFTER